MSEDVVATRAHTYGDARPNMVRTAKLWSAYLGVPISAHDVAMCMVLVKCARASVSHHGDNYLDIRGYSVIAEALSEDR
jgi:hypothetical protein